MSQAIALVLHHPAATRSVIGWSELARCDLPGIPVLTELLEQAAGMQQPSTAMLLERWRDRPEYGRLAELAAAAGMVETAAAAAQELQMAVQKLTESAGPGRRVDELLRKAEEMGLNSDEKIELSSLLKAKAPPSGGA